ncbi:MAG: hypothetical protein PHW75_00545 [Patescibacteria group bacterium]|nr:hypothetical protein [Patescibacteria group bacterium]
MKTKKKSSRIYTAVIIFIILLAAALYFYKERPNLKLPILDNIDYLCNFNVKVSGDSMAPFLTQGKTYSFDKCFAPEEIKSGVVVNYNDGGTIRLGIIREIINNGIDNVYKISNERDYLKINPVLLSDIYGIYQVDTSETKYVTKENDKKQDLFTRVAIAKIPLTGDVDRDSPEETSSFSRRRDKFCLLTDAKEQLYNYGVTIQNLGTKEILKRTSDQVLRAGYNIDCEPVTLESGRYILVGTQENEQLFQFKFEITD